jgi:hypothetical protein
VSSLTTTAEKNTATTFMSVVRMFAGGITWASPAISSRLFGLGAIAPGGSPGLVARLFGIRDFVLGAAVHHPDPSVRKAVLQAGIVCDSADVVASLIAVRAGAPKTALLGATAGAGLFAAIGIVALKNTH